LSYTQFMVKSLFEFNRYRSYMTGWIQAQPKGEKGRIARAMDCHPAYVSLVLQERSDLSPEQALKLCRFWNFTREQQEFFILLVSHERAGTSLLKKFYWEQIQAILDRRHVLKDRFEFKKTISSEDQATYYSAWYYGAVHMLLSIPRFQSTRELIRYLRLSQKTAEKVIEFLIRTGLAMQEGSQIKTGTVNIHLGTDSPMISKHHTNWRLQCIRAIEQDERNEDLHYSSIVTVSEKDIPKIREALVRAIEGTRAIVMESPEEDLYCYSLDLFKVGQEIK
jgi:uncharacterized protein (TIGR02147 family)